MYRIPKKHDIEHGHSLMQKQETSCRLKEEPVNSQSFLKKTEDNVRQDELFFLRFFKMKESLVGKKKPIKEEEEEKEDEDEDIDDNIDSFGGMDFASEMKKNKNKKKNKKDEENEDDSENEEDSDS